MTKTILFTALRVNYTEKNCGIMKPRYSKHILPVPWPFVSSRLHCTFNLCNREHPKYFRQFYYVVTNHTTVTSCGLVFSFILAFSSKHNNIPEIILAFI